MALEYVIKTRARREIERLAEWWSVHRVAAPGAVRLDVEAVLFVVTQHPSLGHKVDTGRAVQVRRYLMTRTQHWLYFRVKNNVIEVLSVWSTRRGREPQV